jgi:glycosyltransferase involved in cell wall biosynthesis
MQGGIVMITSGFPRLSETFVLNELLALEGAGALAGIFATKPGDEAFPQPGSGTLLDRVEVLPDAPPAVQAAHVAERVGRGGAMGVHAYFAHAPSAVAEHAARMLDVPYTFGVHARDLRKVAPAELARRARAAARVIACNRDVAHELRRTGATVHLIPHGVDLRRFRPAPPPAPEPLRLLAVGRLVEKKGFEVLVEAVRRLPVPFCLRVVGDGPLQERLARAVAAVGAGDRIELLGPRTHDELPGEYARAHALVVPSVEDSTGDRDGLPNVILEAMASGRPVVASAIAGIPSAISDGDTGLLVPPGDPVALRKALERLAGDPSLRARAGAAARARVERDFELASCAARLRRCLEGAYG